MRLNFEPALPVSGSTHSPFATAEIQQKPLALPALDRLSLAKGRPASSYANPGTALNGKHPAMPALTEHEFRDLSTFAALIDHARENPRLMRLLIVHLGQHTQHTGTADELAAKMRTALQQARHAKLHGHGLQAAFKLRSGAIKFVERQSEQEYRNCVGALLTGAPAAARETPAFREQLALAAIERRVYTPSAHEQISMADAAKLLPLLRPGTEAAVGFRALREHLERETNPAAQRALHAELVQQNGVLHADPKLQAAEFARLRMAGDAMSNHHDAADIGAQYAAVARLRDPGAQETELYEMLNKRSNASGDDSIRGELQHMPATLQPLAKQLMAERFDEFSQRESAPVSLYSSYSSRNSNASYGDWSASGLYDPPHFVEARRGPANWEQIKRQYESGYDGDVSDNES